MLRSLKNVNGEFWQVRSPVRENPPKTWSSTFQELLDNFRDWLEYGDTVDGQNPAPPRMIIIPLFIGF